MTKKNDDLKHSPSRLYEFVPDAETITANNIIELSEKIRVGISGNLLGKLSSELQKHFKEVA